MLRHHSNGAGADFRGKFVRRFACHGGLSNDAGRVRISWHLAKAADGRQDLNFVWQENGGPSVSEPKTKGFGSRLISRVLAADFLGDVRIIYPSGGVVCTLTAKLG